MSIAWDGDPLQPGKADLAAAIEADRLTDTPRALALYESGIGKLLACQPFPPDANDELLLTIAKHLDRAEHLKAQLAGLSPPAPCFHRSTHLGKSSRISP